MNCTYLQVTHHCRDPSSVWDTVFGSLTVLVVFLGVFGNIAALSHICRRYPQKVIFKALVLADVGVLLSAFGYYGLWQVFTCTQYYSHPVFAWFCVIMHYPASLFHMMSSWFVLILTLTRCLAVCRPFEHCTGSCFETRLASAITVALAAVVNLPALAELYVEPCLLLDINGTVKNDSVVLGEVQPTSLRKHPVYAIVYRLVMSRVVLNGIGPFLIICIAVSIITQRVYQANRSRIVLLQDTTNSMYLTCPSMIEETRQKSAHQVQSIAAVQVVLIFKYLLTYFPDNFLEVIELCYFGIIKTEAQRVLFQRWVDVSNFLVVLNSATNCLVYLRCGQIIHKSLNIFLRMISGGQAIVKSPQLELLQTSWKMLKESHDGRYGEFLLLNTLQHDPQLAWHFKLHPDLPHTWADSDRLADTGAAMDALFETIVSEIDEHTGKLEIRSQLREVGALHQTVNVNLTGSQWNVIKTFMLTSVRNLDLHEKADPDIDHPLLGARKEETLKAWERVTCLIISEMKSGYSLRKSTHEDLGNKKEFEMLTGL